MNAKVPNSNFLTIMDTINLKITEHHVIEFIEGIILYYLPVKLPWPTLNRLQECTALPRWEGTGQEASGPRQWSTQGKNQMWNVTSNCKKGHIAPASSQAEPERRLNLKKRVGTHYVEPEMEVEDSYTFLSYPTYTTITHCKGVYRSLLQSQFQSKWNMTLKLNELTYVQILSNPSYYQHK